MKCKKVLKLPNKIYNECVKVIDNAKAVINENEPLAKNRKTERIKKQEEKLEKAMQKYGIDDEKYS